MCPKCFVTKMTMTFVTAERGGRRECRWRMPGFCA